MAKPNSNVDCRRTRRAQVAPTRPRGTRVDRLVPALADYVADELAARSAGMWL